MMGRGRAAGFETAMEWAMAARRSWAEAMADFTTWEWHLEQGREVV